MSSRHFRNVLVPILAVLAALLCTQAAEAATTGGTALQAAFTALDDLVGGYGKQIMVLVGFVTAVFGIMAMNATSVIVKFIGFVIFLAVGLPAALTLSGATI